MRFLTLLWKLKLSCFILPYLACLCYSEANLVIFIAFCCFWTKLYLCAKTSSILVSNLKLTFSEKLPMCSSRGRLWISWGYAHNHWMMLQLAMTLKVCRNTRFRQSSCAARRQAVRPAREAVRSALWRSDRPPLAVRPDKSRVCSLAVRPANG